MVDKTFRNYLEETDVDYAYTLKLALDHIDDKVLDRLEWCLSKYKLVSASKFRETPIQANPLDFPNLRNQKVFITDLVMKYPASRDFLETYIASCLGINEQSVVVYSDTDPRQYETELILTRNSPEYKENYNPALNKTDYTGEEVECANHDEQKMLLLKELEELRKKRPFDIVESPLSGPTDINHDDIGNEKYDTFNDYLVADELGFFGRVKKYSPRK